MRKFAALGFFALAGVLVVSGAPATPSTNQEQLFPVPCGAGFADGTVAGVRTCIRGGHRCNVRNDGDYHRSGFHCHTGSLTEFRPRLRRADLSLTTVDSPDPVRIGAELTYWMTIANHGPGPARDVFLADALWPSVTYVASASSQGRCSDRGGAGFQCELGDIPAGEGAVRVTIVVRVLAGWLPIKRNYGFVESARVDPYFRNNIAWITTTVAVGG
jgi:uncharacterized repeat protein (TIGR01451 family)